MKNKPYEKREQPYEQKNEVIDSRRNQVIFESVYGKTPNFMTPDKVRYGRTKNYVYELSKGDFLGEEYYGVSVVKPKDSGLGYEKSRLSMNFDSKELAESYIKRMDKIRVEK